VPTCHGIPPPENGLRPTAVASSALDDNLWSALSEGDMVTGRGDSLSTRSVRGLTVLWSFRRTPPRVVVEPARRDPRVPVSARHGAAAALKAGMRSSQAPAAGRAGCAAAAAARGA
jgi:hypothetical protein